MAALCSKVLVLPHDQRICTWIEFPFCFLVTMAIAAGLIQFVRISISARSGRSISKKDREGDRPVVAADFLRGTAITPPPTESQD